MTAALLRAVEMNLQAARRGMNPPSGMMFPYSSESVPTYELCPKSIRPAFISSRQSARVASAGYERNQYSLTNSLNALVTGRTPWVARSVCLCPTFFFRSSHLFTVENDRKNRSTNLHQVLLPTRQELYADD